MESKRSSWQIWDPARSSRRYVAELARREHLLNELSVLARRYCVFRGILIADLPPWNFTPPRRWKRWVVRLRGG